MTTRSTRLPADRSACLLLILISRLAATPGSAAAAEPPNPPTGAPFRECPQCPSMTVVPAGHFTMARKRARDGRKDDDPEGALKTLPEREFDIAAFALGTYPVTRREYATFVRGTRRAVQPGCHLQHEGVWILDPTKDWGHPGFSQTEQDPVVCVNWNDAQDYVRWLNAKERPFPYDDTPDPYRLPTWEEKEYATGAGATSLYYWGDVPRRDHANYGKATCFPCGPMREGADQWLYTSPIGSFPPNPWGLFDMAGNVWQWVESCRTYMRERPVSECHSRVIHGGSWLTNPEYLQTGERSGATIDHRDNEIGFRVARTLGPVRP